MHTTRRSDATKRATDPHKGRSTRTITYAVSGAEVAGLRAGLLGIYSVKADALSAALAAYVGGTTELVVIAHHRDDIRAIEGLLNQLGWEQVESLEAITVTGSRAFLREGFHAALLEASEDISSDVHELDWPLDALPRIATAIGQAKTLLGRVVELSETDAADASV